MKPEIYSENDHGINHDFVDNDALDIIFQLKSKGYTAYLVGGGVRDLILQKVPKDFDVSTSATPKEIKDIFQRRCLLIGKRFRLAHIRSHKKVIEVSTFRTGETEAASLVIRDNQWGTAEEDVLRRDFTMNALYYDPTTRCVLDYVDGFSDIQKHLLRSIGNPLIRFKQDPVRMIRLLKFQARFGFQIDPKCALALESCKEEILKSSPERLVEEIFKMLESKAAKPFFELLFKSEFLEILFPCFSHFFATHRAATAYSFLDTVDSMDTLSRTQLLSALIFPILDEEIRLIMEKHQAPLNSTMIYELTTSLLDGINISSFAHFPKKILNDTHSLLCNQYLLTPLKGSPRYNRKFSSKAAFQEAIQFLNVRARVDKTLQKVYTKWENLLEESEDD